MFAFTTDLERTRHAVSPRYAPPPTPLRAVIVHGGVTLLWLLLFLRAFSVGGLLAWSTGLAYIAYDTALLLFVFRQTLPLLRPAPPPSAVTNPPSLGVILAAYNEAATIPATLAALFAQTEPPNEIVIADDGSNDATATSLAAYGLKPPPLGQISTRSPIHPTLRWLRLPHAGKAQALNEALAHLNTELILTLDADTIPEPDAIAATRRAFQADPTLVAATGVLFPDCPATIEGRIFQCFQSTEYMRNFLSRYAWATQDGLLLISGAFAAYQRQALLAVGGFDPDCLVEDYELSHRLLDHAATQGYRWRTDVIGTARASTDAPATLASFLKQRQRWFGGFLQTQLWYRHMIGNPKYGRLGTRMLPVKAFDTMQPIYGLTGIALLIVFATTGHQATLAPATTVIAAKIALDLLFYLWSLHLYRLWVGPSARINLAAAIIATAVEPFTFQVLRHTGATLGWLKFLTSQKRWAGRTRIPPDTSSPTTSALLALGSTSQSGTQSN
jgi:cellulose synthase/poly-beta-1,6-N-acetylglucosamine synthase-like glycosyltransferase